jgi:hypothetical protein
LIRKKEQQLKYFLPAKSKKDILLLAVVIVLATLLQNRWELMSTGSKKSLKFLPQFPVTMGRPRGVWMRIWCQCPTCMNFNPETIFCDPRSPDP